MTRESVSQAADKSSPHFDHAPGELTQTTAGVVLDSVWRRLAVTGKLGHDSDSVPARQTSTSSLTTPLQDSSVGPGQTVSFPQGKSERKALVVDERQLSRQTTQPSQEPGVLEVPHRPQSVPRQFGSFKPSCGSPRTSRSQECGPSSRRCEPGAGGGGGRVVKATFEGLLHSIWALWCQQNAWAPDHPFQDQSPEASEPCQR